MLVFAIASSKLCYLMGNKKKNLCSTVSVAVVVAVIFLFC